MNIMKNGSICKSEYLIVCANKGGGISCVALYIPLAPYIQGSIDQGNIGHSNPGR